MMFDNEGGNQDTLLRVGLTNPHTTHDSTGGSVTNMASEYGTMLTEPGIWPIVEVERPYLSNFLAANTYASLFSDIPAGKDELYGDPSIAIGAQSGTDEQTPIPLQSLTNIGSDFRFYGLVAPPNPVRFQISGFQLWPVNADPPERTKTPKRAETCAVTRVSLKESSSIPAPEGIEVPTDHRTLF